MNRSQLWILAAAGGCFLAGLTVGLALPDVSAALRGEAPTNSDEDYVRAMIADYRLDADQSRLLRMAVRSWQEDELRVVRQFQVAQLPGELQSRLCEVRSRLVERTRQSLGRNPDQLARYDRSVAADGSK